MTCGCETVTTVPPPGHQQLPRPWSRFAQVRAQLMTMIREQPALHGWHPRTQDDLGVMLLEMWAYVAHLQGFYDHTLAQEFYPRTAKQRATLRRQLALLGYRPRPAIAAKLPLVLEAQGESAVSLPAGTAFRADSDRGQGQIFRLMRTTEVVPDLNRREVEAPRRPFLDPKGRDALIDFQSFWFAADATIRKGDILFFQLGSKPSAQDMLKRAQRRAQAAAKATAKANPLTSLTSPSPNQPAPALKSFSSTKPTLAASALVSVSNDRDRWIQSSVVQDVEETRTAGGDIIQSVILREPVTLPGRTRPHELRVLKPTRRYRLWESPNDGKHEKGLAPNLVSLDGFYPELGTQQPLVITYEGQSKAFWIDRRRTLHRIVEQPPAVEMKIDNKKTVIQPPPVKLPFTQLSVSDGSKDIDARVATSLEPWIDKPPQAFTVHGVFESVGMVLTTRQPEVAMSSRLALEEAEGVEMRESGVREMVVQDRAGQAYAVQGRIARDSRTVQTTWGSYRSTVPMLLAEPGEEALGAPLAMPATVYGNVAWAEQGMLVEDELVGSGDASTRHQRFPLRHRGLLYDRTPTGRGFESSLRVWVDGVLWREVPSFFGQSGTAQVFVLDEQDDGTTHLCFGDGIQGARLPSGRHNVRASYRYALGGYEVCDAGALSQMMAPVSGLARVFNPLASLGGAKPEGLDAMRGHGPTTAMFLERVVSVPEMQAAVRSIPGVVQASVAWRWDHQRQSRCLQVFVHAADGLQSDVRARLLSICEPGLQVDVRTARPRPLFLSLDLDLDPRLKRRDVLDAVHDVLMAPKHGLLSAETLGIGQPLFRSVLLAAILRVPGVIDVKGLSTQVMPNTSAMAGFGVRGVDTTGVGRRAATRVGQPLQQGPVVATEVVGPSELTDALRRQSDEGQGAIAPLWIPWRDRALALSPIEYWDVSQGQLWINGERR